MITEVIKGVDDDIEFKGFKGRYFNIMISALGASIVIVLFLYIIGFSSFWLLLIAAITIAGVYIYVKQQMKQNGKYGHITNTHKPPKYIIQNKPFYQIIPSKND